MRLPIHPPTHPSMFHPLTHLSIHLSIHPSINLPVHPSIHPSIHLAIHLSIHPPIYPFGLLPLRHFVTSAVLEGAGDTPVTMITTTQPCLIDLTSMGDRPTPATDALGWAILGCRCPGAGGTQRYHQTQAGRWAFREGFLEETTL
jgi:hypothetical protein